MLTVQHRSISYKGFFSGHALAPAAHVPLPNRRNGLFQTRIACDSFTVDRREVTIEAGPQLANRVRRRVRTVRWNLVLLAAQSQAPDSQSAPLQVDEEIHALCEALIPLEGRSDP
jgi:hypothetical protein